MNNAFNSKIKFKSFTFLQISTSIIGFKFYHHRYHYHPNESQPNVDYVKLKQPLNSFFNSSFFEKSLKKKVF